MLSTGHYYVYSAIKISLTDKCLELKQYPLRHIPPTLPRQLAMRVNAPRPLVHICDTRVVALS